jgi:hypothetical protein
MKELEPIVSKLSDELEIDLHSKTTLDELRLAVCEYVNYLMANDPNKLMHILYRVDVSEKLLKANLQSEEKDAAAIIADMIVDRQLGKFETRKKFRSGGDIPENEKW